MLSLFLSNEKILTNEDSGYFKISSKQKSTLDTKKYEDKIIKEASENIEKKLLKIGS